MTPPCSKVLTGGVWVTRSVELPTLDLNLGLHLGNVSSNTALGSMWSLLTNNNNNRKLTPIIFTSLEKG